MLLGPSQEVTQRGPGYMDVGEAYSRARADRSGLSGYPPVSDHIEVGRRRTSGVRVPEARFVVDPASASAPVDRRLFGSFVEHLGRGVYTGIHEPEIGRAHV